MAPVALSRSRGTVENDLPLALTGKGFLNNININTHIPEEDGKRAFAKTRNPRASNCSFVRVHPFPRGDLSLWDWRVPLGCPAVRASSEGLDDDEHDEGGSIRNKIYVGNRSERTGEGALVSHGGSAA